MRSDQAAQSFLQAGLKNLKGWRLRSLSEPPVSLLSAFVVKKFLLVSAPNLSCFSLCPLIFLQLTTVKDWVPSSSQPPLRYQKAATSLPRAVLSPGWTSPVPLPPLTGQLLQLLRLLGGPLRHSLQFNNTFPVFGRTQNWSCCSRPVWSLFYGFLPSEVQVYNAFSFKLALSYNILL